MLNWLRAWRDSIRELWKPDPVTEEMVYTVVPTIWIRKMKVRKRLVGYYPELTNLKISDARIYTSASDDSRCLVGLNVTYDVTPRCTMTLVSAARQVHGGRRQKSKQD